MAASAAATTRRCINHLPGTIDRSEPHRRPLSYSYTVDIVVSGHFIWIISDTITSAALADLFGVSVHARRFLGALPLARLMSQLGQTRTSRRTNVMSALPFMHKDKFPCNPKLMDGPHPWRVH